MGKFPKSSYRIGVSTLQAVALSVLSGQTAPMTFEDVGQAMGCVTENGGVNEDIVKRVLHSLSCNPKYRVLKKTGPGNPKVVNAEDKFEPNPAFSSKARRFTIPMADLDNLGATLQKVHQDRSYLIDACVVRIMKVFSYHPSSLDNHPLPAQSSLISLLSGTQATRPSNPPFRSRPAAPDIQSHRPRYQEAVHPTLLPSHMRERL